MPSGRPTLYDPAYCEAVIAHCNKGGTVMSFGPAVAGVRRETVWAWRNVHPDFDEACEIAKGKALALSEFKHWELAQNGENCRSLEYRMQNLGENQWRRVEGRELSGPGGGPIEAVGKIERVFVDANASN